MSLQRGDIVPESLGNDNWYGYIQDWIYQVGVTWMEKTVATPYWTGLTLFTVRQRGRKRKHRHLLHDAMYQADARVAFKGQVFTAPFDWKHMQEQFQRLEQEDTLISLPHSGEVLASMVKLQISSGLVCLSKHIKHATVRRNVVVQLIRMFKDSGHPDYQHLHMPDVEVKAQNLAATDEPSVPYGLAEVSHSDVESEEESTLVDKAATPAERIWNEDELHRELDRARPNILTSQRDSDALKEIEASRASAFSRFSTLELKTGSKLVDQFQGSYIPRVFNMTLPWFVGGPDLKGRERFRRVSDDAPEVSHNTFTRMLPRRVEAQIRWDWDLIPSVWGLNFATMVNTGASLSIQRTLRRSSGEETQERDIAEAAAKVYKLLWEGEYIRADGVRQRVQGDTAKILDAIGLTATQRALVQNYRFMSARIPGTRQVRRSINHLVFSSRVVYGLPVFMTITPSERHSMLMIRLIRYRLLDPAIRIANPEFARWAGCNSPSLQSREDTQGQEQEDVH